jgi:DNA-binding beta-propeller fold protein YncE
MNRYFVAASIAGLVLTGCGQGNVSPQSATSTAVAQTAGHATPYTRSPDAVMYVANGSFGATGQVSVVDTKSGKVSRTITNGIHFPYAVAVDANGNAYVANRKGKSNVTV